MRAMLIPAFLLAALTACGDEPGQDAAAAPAGAAVAPAGPSAGTASRYEAIELTDELLEAWARGLRKEAEIVRRPGRGTHYGVMVSEHGDEGPEVLEAAGIPAADYNAVAGTVGPVFHILNSQGKLGRQFVSMDLERLDEEQRRRYTGDPFEDLSPRSAEVLRRHMDRLGPLWHEAVAITAQHG